ncbi:hypothetical protein [Mesorhizobium sp.]|uniref:hypothetical protein n=1 Tax=Mesorhizobium sp. TaxID=1871066 RepID=UPI000FE9B6A9|nr:hypothetical protein [Mesorhizobium sp.]RWK62253.1 MAG: hypothetical protein EOR49_13825 [Mesorhizobium sp.]RWM48961.1 MAG: hypothetical protein EOR76_11350 [Mesorhizobium sp.]RWM54445.1 MAG: hypothetical protein EOR78_17825 [Mesorhizobium sp.]RWM61667.1 MAG: hypothetical protein EOR79_04845 [Mesorhizobium sp.]RWN03055.1 MAG: hypothetical protein EOR85_12015 [Mesorhizobium sp.]
MDFGVFGHGHLSIGDLSTYHPRGVEMRFFVIAEENGAFTFVGPRGARPWCRNSEPPSCRT